MEQIVEKRDKPVIKIFLIVIGFVIAIDFVMFLMKRYIEGFPYMTNLIAIFLVVISCSYILIKYFSKYLYTIQEGQLVFYRVIGKKRFEILRADCTDLIYVGPYDENQKGEKCSYNFTFDKNGEEVYIGKLKGNNNRISFLFSPNKSILKELKRYKK
jgi:hypothetical protein